MQTMKPKEVLVGLALFCVTAAGSRAAEKDSIRILGTIGGEVTRSESEAGLLYLIRGAVLEIHDLADPKNPKLLSQTRLDGVISSSMRLGRAMYLFSPDFGARAFDLTNPRAPAAIPGFDPDCWEAMLRSGEDQHILLITSSYKGHTTGRSLFNIADPLKPVRLDDQKDERRTSYLGHYMYELRMSEDGRSVVLATTDATSADKAGQITLLYTPSVQEEYHPRLLAADSAGRRLLALTETPKDDISLDIFDLSDPLHPTVVGSRQCVALPDPSEEWEGQTSRDGPPHPRSIAIAGRLAFVADAADGLYILDVSDLAHMRTRGRLAISGGATEIVLHGDFAYVGDETPTLYAVNISDPDAPRLTSTLRGVRARLGFQGKTGYAAAGAEGVRLLDLTDPGNPKPLGFFKKAGDCFDIAVADGRAILGARKISLLDLAEPRNPRLLAATPFIAEDSPDDYASQVRVSLQGDRVGAVWGDRTLVGGGSILKLRGKEGLFETDILGLANDAAWSRSWICLTYGYRTTGGLEFGATFRDIATDEKLHGDPEFGLCDDSFDEHTLYTEGIRPAAAIPGTDIFLISNGQCGVYAVEPLRVVQGK